MKVSNRKKAERQRFVKDVLIGLLLPPCPNCDGQGPHYVPPSMGEDGFYICDPVVKIVDL